MTSEQIKDTTQEPQTQEANPQDNQPQKTPEEILAEIARGKMTLLQPLRAAGQDITELRWNFRNLTGWEYADAMDCDASSNAFHLSTRQAIALFAASAAKETTIKDETGREIHPLDAQDIRRRLSIDDSMKAAQSASAFFYTSAQVGNKRISKE